jgi:hypothetical protein
MAVIANKEKAIKGKAPTNGFKKGKSGNPAGRPKMTPEALDLVAACKERSPEALTVLIDIMNNGENERNRITAAMAIIERGHGKPEQPIKAEVDGKLTVEIVRYGSNTAA